MCYINNYNIEPLETTCYDWGEKCEKCDKIICVDSRGKADYDFFKKNVVEHKIDRKLFGLGLDNEDFEVIENCDDEYEMFIEGLLYFNSYKDILEQYWRYMYKFTMWLKENNIDYKKHNRNLHGIKKRTYDIRLDYDNNLWMVNVVVPKSDSLEELWYHFDNIVKQLEEWEDEFCE